MAEWTPTMVEDRLESAADVFRSLPEVMAFFLPFRPGMHAFIPCLSTHL